MKKKTVMYTILWLFPLVCVGLYFLFFGTTVAVVAFFTFWLYMMFVFAILTRARWDIVRNRTRRITYFKRINNIVLFLVSVGIFIFIVLVLLAYAVAYY